ncbi:hypothetical protein BDV95DRAFT_375847 [Massariosphaeria phaeospora]|uniref:Uncharacterized protein n=1 Tax=Massariosphaeria phaeospora TaxID=100035 RepID=A0A7C8IFW9_9PLEO|nr:hypothetical protein BDV95DRAFT_375847 [Massariosphaeria phaeospora]
MKVPASQTGMFPWSIGGLPADSLAGTPPPRLRLRQHHAGSSVGACRHGMHKFDDTQRKLQSAKSLLLSKACRQSKRASNGGRAGGGCLPQGATRHLLHNGAAKGVDDSKSASSSHSGKLAEFCLIDGGLGTPPVDCSHPQSPSDPQAVIAQSDRDTTEFQRRAPGYKRVDLHPRPWRCAPF